MVVDTVICYYEWSTCRSRRG